jgi:ubiquinone/menaquinone biosynthesis C-methylase UbiE
MLKRFTEYISHFGSKKEKEPSEAYDLWAPGYDNQSGNLVLDLDEEIFSSFLADFEIENKSVVDVGCGTGRHWKAIMEKSPAKLIGYDVSAGMLNELKKKFPQAETHLLNNDLLTGLANSSHDLIISTLTIAHIENIDDAFREWDRVLKPGADIIITDYHPEILAKGGKRTFQHDNKTMIVQNFIHSLEMLRVIAKQLQWTELRFAERKIDESMRSYYEKQNALAIFEKFKAVPVIYAIHFKKTG